MFSHETRWAHFIVPILFILFGGWVADHESWAWEWAGVLIWVVAIVMSIWLVTAGILFEQTRRVDSDSDFYERIHRMTDEEKIIAGLVPSPDKVRVEHREDNQTGFSLKYDFLNISPVKFKAVAYACMNGKPFSSRSLSGKGKLLSDNEYRTLKDDLLDGGYIKPRSEKDDRQGFEWTNSGTGMLKDVLGLEHESV